MTKKQKKILIRIITCLIFTIVFIFIPAKNFIKFCLFLIPYFIIAYDVLIKAFKGIINGRVFDENFLMAVATIGALILGLNNGEYKEAVFVLLFYQTGELFQSYSVSKSRKNVAKLMDIRPDSANLQTDGDVVKVHPKEVPVGAIIVVNPGEKVAIDGVVVSGASSLNMTALTGESAPRDVVCGDEIISGSININGALKIKTTKEFENSTVSKILDLVENATSNKSKSENFISKFARVYTPIVCALALLLAIIPPLFNLFILKSDASFSVWIYRGLSFLVASCPCALVISIPLTFFSGIGGASRRGILIKGSNYLETLSKTKIVVFDKTGTLTKGDFEVSEVYAENISNEELIEYATLCESASTHPIAKSLARAYGKKIDKRKVDGVMEIIGQGVTATVNGNFVAVGNAKLMRALNVSFNETTLVGTVIYVAINNKYCGYIIIRDNIKKSSYSAIKQLKKAGVNKIVMLTGDNQAVACSVAESLKIDEVHSQLLPLDKVEIVEKLLKENSGKLLFVGDGINDAPVLSLSDIGIAMGKVGSDAAIESSDVVIMDDNVEKIPKAIKISKKCLSIVYQNIVFAIGVKVLALVFVALGLANMWLAIFADVGVMILAVLNATRSLFILKR